MYGIISLRNLLKWVKGGKKKKINLGTQLLWQIEDGKYCMQRSSVMELHL